ncbi:ATP-dependent DNA helicase RecQ [Hygrophoropsis aurantiaca]|uniref:ATP-dependent DNA helicase RecQ n=1 Tax=Hygrophoropsis aurantiaca TaxID=72124 RepID=A0ACB8AN54_9AGAM|nr:ATP-dependent DNA helicase RecQ [Hygrophoropsis aurantiaca]
MDGISQLLIAPTGGGKTACFYGILLVMDYLRENPHPRFPTPPSNPVVLIVTPLNELGNSHAAEMMELGIKAIAVNSTTIRSAYDDGRNIFKEIRRCEWAAVLLSVELLCSEHVEDILEDDNFLNNLVQLGLDETHVVLEWGGDFRPAYCQLGLIHKRLPSRVPLLAVTATLEPGRAYDDICKTLNLRKGEFFSQRLSSERTNVRTVIHELSHNLNGTEFPELAWLVAPGGKSIAYCKTIEQGYRLYKYLASTLPPGDSRRRRVRVWSSITPADYNAETLRLFREDPDTCCIVATVAFGMGMNLRNVINSVNVGVPKTGNLWIQQNGRAGRDLDMYAVGHTYVERSVMKKVKESLRTDEHSHHRESGSKMAIESDLDNTIQRLLTAHIEGRCLEAEKNIVYDNPGPLSRLNCHAASRLYPCSSCEIFVDPSCPQTSSVPMASESTVESYPKLRSFGPPAPIPLTKDMRMHASQKLQTFAHTRWQQKNDSFSRNLPSSCLWTGNTFTFILDHFYIFRNLENISISLSQWKHLHDDGSALAKLLIELNERYDNRRTKRVEIRTARAAATKARNKAVKQGE